MKKSGKYIDLWTKNKGKILDKLKNELILEPQDFQNAGNRKSYSFNLQIEKGKVSNNIRGSAVARDFASVLLNTPEIKAILKAGTYKIKMDKDFYLTIQKVKKISTITSIQKPSTNPLSNKGMGHE